MIQLNQEQMRAVCSITEFLKGNQTFFGLYGYAGTGKSTVIQHVFSQSPAQQTAVAMTAPTHKAVGVLAAMAEDHDLSGVTFATIHSLCAVKKFREKGEIKFRPDPTKPPPIRNYRTVIIDECSMISSEMWEWICNAIQGTRVKVICMGDPAQLPPVGEEASPTFDLPHVRLRTIVRNAGAIQQAGTRVRENILSQVPFLADDAQDEHGEIRNLHHEQWLDLFLEHADNGAKALAFTNEAVDWINDWIRERKFGEDAASFEVGEKLVVISTAEIGPGVILHAETELRVEGAFQHVKLGLPCWRLRVHDGMTAFPIDVLDDEQRPAFLQRLSAARTKGQALGGSAWSDYYDLLEAFIRVRSGWATTIHKSQGSTYEQVFLVQTDVLRRAKRDHVFRNALLYVAYSRARQGLYIS